MEKKRTNGRKDPGRKARMTKRQGVYSGDSLNFNLKDYTPSPQQIPYGANVEGVLFDGYPQLVKHTGSEPAYRVRIEKDIMVPMRDGVRLAADVYRPDIEGEKFPALLAFGFWG